MDDFRLADDLQQDDHLEGLPLGTRGGISIPYTFPMDAEYIIRVRLARDVNESVPLYLEPQNLEVSIDGERIQVFTLPGVTPAPPPARPAQTGRNGASALRLSGRRFPRSMRAYASAPKSAKSETMPTTTGMCGFV